MKVSQVVMTPKKAAELLLSNPETNRPLRAKRVDQLVRIILNGEWRLTHQPIAIGKDGVLLDGQHRLAAIVKSGVAVPILIAYDADPETFAVIDTGARRTPGDILHSAGYTDTALLAAAARLYVGYRENMIGASPWMAVGGRTGTMDQVTTTQLLEAVEEHHLLADLVPEAARIARGVGRYGFRTGALVALVVIAEDSPVFPQLRAPWVQGLSDGADLPTGSPLLAWRKWALVPLRRSRAEVMATLLKSWNAWQDKDSFMAQMKIRHGEAMPLVHSPKAALEG